MRAGLAGIIVATLLIIGVFAQDGGIEILNHKEKVFLNKNCKTTKTCDLKKVEYFVEDYKVAVGDSYNYGTRFFARYETKSVKSLEKYVLVQFIKGCKFSSRLVSDQVIVSQDVSYPRDDEVVLFKFPEWTIDSGDYDPVYSTFPDKPRLFGYRWNTVPGSFSINTEKLYGQKKPKTPKLYVVDHPGSAFYEDGVAHNTSLQFRTCIYRTKDVPLNTSFGDVDFAKPLHCYEWNSSFVYNHSTNKFDSSIEIAPACK